jgi:hypothetical protein
MMKNGRSHRLDSYTPEEIMDALHSLERRGLIYSVIDADGKLRWYAAEYGPKGRKLTKTNDEDKLDENEKP